MKRCVDKVSNASKDGKVENKKNKQYIQYRLRSIYTSPSGCNIILVKWVQSPFVKL